MEDNITEEELQGGSCEEDDFSRIYRRTYY